MVTWLFPDTDVHGNLDSTRSPCEEGCQFSWQLHGCETTPADAYPQEVTIRQTQLPCQVRSEALRYNCIKAWEHKLVLYCIIDADGRRTGAEHVTSRPACTQVRICADHVRASSRAKEGG